MTDKDIIKVELQNLQKVLEDRANIWLGHGRTKLLSFANACSGALELLKDSGQDEGWLCEKRTSGRQPTDLLCACGNKVYFTTLLFKDGFTANELYCPNCGLSMRSPQDDKDGVWLRKRWEEVVLKEREAQPAIIEGSDVIHIGKCPSCNVVLQPWGANYCHKCGQAVKWE